MSTDHRLLAGRRDELASLVETVRHAIALMPEHLLDAETTTALAAEVHDVADILAARRIAEPGAGYGSGEAMDLFAFDCVFGRYNPLALPVVVTWEPPVARATATFTRPYQGPPGCVHGAVIAGVLDQVCNVANIGNGVPGLTRTLEVSYAKPTPLASPITMEARVESIDDVDITTAGRIMTDTGAVTATCVGRFRRLTSADSPGSTTSRVAHPGDLGWSAISPGTD